MPNQFAALLSKAFQTQPSEAGKIDRLPGPSSAVLLVAKAGPECHLTPFE